MIWVVIVLVIIISIIWKFNQDSKEEQRRNQSFGGMKKLFPEFVDYYELNGYELVEDSGTKLIYKKALTNNSTFNKHLYLGVESRFTNIAFGYVIKSDGKKINGKNVEFRKDIRPEEVEMTIRKIIGDFDLRGILD